MQAIGIPTGAEVKQGAYLDHLRSGACLRQEARTLAVLALARRPLTRHELAEIGGMALSAACGRVATLMDRGLIEVAGTVKPEGVRSPRSTLQLTEKGRLNAAAVVRHLDNLVGGGEVLV